MRELIERRVPQYLGVYLGAAFGIVQFIAFMEERYAISPHWTNLALLCFALLIPSVVLFTYNHGKPGKDEWTRSEKIGIPVNLVLALGILFAVFGTKDLGAMTMSVTTKDETGKTVEREVVKSSHRRRLALFNFDAPAGDTALTWMQYGLPNALYIDLLQDMFIDARVPAYFREKLREVGFRSEVNVPLSLKRQIAEEQHLPHFTDVKLSRAGDQVAVDYAVYETASGKLVERTNVQSNNVFELIDQLTLATKKSLEIPETDKVQDLPVSEVLTSSLPAFRYWVEGVMTLQLNDQWPQAAQQLEKAVQTDPTFANAWLALHNLYLLSGQVQKSLPPLQKAMDHQYRMPERLQYDMKAEYYAVAKQDAGKARAVAEMKTTLFPDDVQAWGLLAQMQNMVDDQKGRIVSYNKILELDPAQHEVLRELGSIYERQGEFDNALKYYSQYSERFPKKQEATLSIGSLQQLQGKHDQARASFNKALLVAPEDVNTLIAVGHLERDLGNFEAAERQYQSALAAAKTDDARQRVLDAQSDYYAMRGKMTQAVRVNEEMLTQARKVKPRLLTALDELNSLDRYVRAGQMDVARRMRARAAADLQPPYDVFVAVGDLRIGLASEDTAAITSAIAGVETVIRNLGVKALQSNVLNARGQLAELRGQCQEAIKHHEERLQMSPANHTIHVDIGRCYRKLKQPQKAIEHLQKALTVVPASPRANYEIGLAYLDAGDRSKAAEHVNRAVQALSEADPGFKLAAEAKAKARELSGTN